MPLLNFLNSDGSPNESSCFVNALLTSSLYHRDEQPGLQYAASVGGTRQLWRADPATFEPDVLVITTDEALVVIGGTTNNAQFVEHCASAFFPAQDASIPLRPLGRPFVVGSFLMGERLVEPLIEAAISSIGLGPVRITGHSYGAAAGHIYGRHLVNSVHPPTLVEIMTFGEPMAYDGRQAVVEPTVHIRFIATVEGTIFFAADTLDVDPVTLMPTGCMEFFQFAKFVKYLRTILSLSWSPHGDGWKINNGTMVRAEAVPFPLGTIPFIGAVDIVKNLPLVDLHNIDLSYLPKSIAAWQRSGKNPELSFLLPFARAYIASPFSPPLLTGPDIPASVLNQSFFDPSTSPVTDADRPNWETISAVGGFFPALGSGVFSMTLMRGSLLCGVDGAGFSETFHSSNAADTYLSMQTKFASLLPSRMSLSNGINDPPPAPALNKMSVVAFRFSDDLLTRDVLAVPVVTPVGWNGSAGNADATLAAKITWRNALGQQIAVSYLHCVPNGGMLGAQGNNTRSQAWQGNYITAVQGYCNTVAAQGLGFNTINNSPSNAFGPITSVVYNSTSGYYTLTVTNSVPQGKFRVAMRGFKSLRVLNGRQSAQATGANSFVVFKSAAVHVWDSSGTATPLNGYNLGVPFSNYIVAVPSTATPSLLIARKLGRPFFLQHGRVSRRAA